VSSPVRLFEPIAIGSLTLKNRVVMPPITTLYDYEGGTRFVDFFAERARGGVGMITINLQALYPGRAGQSALVPEESLAERGALTLSHDAHVCRLTTLTQTLRKHDCRACAQLAVYGFWARDGYGTPAEALSPSGITLAGPQYRPGLERLSSIREGRPATVDDLHMIQRDVAKAARRAMDAGFDAVQVQALGGNFLSRFLSPLTNARTDEYGGRLENRARMMLETIRAVRSEVGDDVPVLVRINGDDLLPGGMVPEDYQPLVPMLEDAGVDAIDVMPGWYETRQPVNQMSVPRGAFVYASEALKQVARVPVSANIRITDPGLAERILQEGRADLIDICTPLVADPEWPNKAREGRIDDIRLCTGCCNTYVIRPAVEARHVVVVGGGPAGMEAARVAASRGHRVTLFERREILGGQLLFAELPPHKGEWRTFTTYLTSQMRTLGVDVRLGKKTTADEVIAERPDVVIVATGARPARPVIPGFDLPQVATCVDVLTGKKPTGQRVVIIGGGCNGSETAEFLSDQGKTVTIVEVRDEVALDVDFWNRWVLMDRLMAAVIRMLVNAKVTAITAAGVTVAAGGQPTQFVEADSVVYAIGSQPYNPLAFELEGRVPLLHVIGDCDTPQRVRQAVDAGFRVGMGV
jgi:2,4-dienoyl-CoA reductase (NADPH2)